ncbi:MAG: restriction endonuclease subunit S [Anaerotignum lactatifermentans]
MAKLGDVCQKKIDTIKSTYKGDINYIDISSVDNQRKEIIQTQIMSFEDAPSRAKQLVFPGDILVSTVRPNLNAVALVTEGFDSITVASTGYCVLRCLSNTDNKYVFYFCQSPAFIENMVAQATGASYPAVTSSIVKECSIPLPPLEEQRKIAAVLDKVSDLIAKRRQQLEKLDLLVKARFVEMFGDPVSNSYQFPVLSLLELGELGRGVSKHRPRNAPELLGGKYPLIQTGEVANSDLYIHSYENTYSEVGFQQSKMWKAGTLCITIAANIAKTAILSFDACFPDSVVGFSANEKTNNSFVHYWFSFFQEILEAQAPESAQKNINLKILSELKVIVPDIDEQNCFADFVEQIEETKTRIRESLTKLETLKKALMQEYFD